MKISVVIITHNEEANIGRTLQSVQPLMKDGQGEIIVVDSGSTDHTVGIAESYGARVFVEEWKGYAAQKNSAIEKASGDWILSLDADEELEPELAELIAGQSEPAKINSPEWCLAMALAGKSMSKFPVSQGRTGWLLDSEKEFLSRALDSTRWLLARPQTAHIPARERTR